MSFESNHQYSIPERRQSRRWRPLMAATLAVLFTLLPIIPAQASTPKPAESVDSKQQARLYQNTLYAIRKGHRTNTQAGMTALADYPLYPYLEKQLLYKRLRHLPKADVDAFLSEYDGSVVATQLHKRWLKVLAGKHQWQDFLYYYDDKIANNTLRCYHLEALHQSGYAQLALNQTADLWLSGKSMPDSCDAAFQRWQDAGLQTDELVWQRTKLALNEKNSLLARYLSKRASAELQPYTRRLISVHFRPTRLEKQADFNEKNRYNADIISHGLVRLAAKDAELATRLWIDYRGEHPLSAEQNYTIRDKIARQVIASGSSQALSWLIAHDPNAEDSYLLEWRIRLALREESWDQAASWITLLPPSLQQHPRWRYWLARAQQPNRPEQAQALLETLSAERNYYGFLAAELLDTGYDLNASQLTSESLNELVSQPAIARAKTFFDMGELTSARREWFAAVQTFDQPELIAATRLAHQWGWHQQAILTTIKADHWDDLDIRFPLAYQQNMTQSAQQASIPLDWLYAITRQESAFAEDARSSADARGLMQLRPPTAHLVAKSLGMAFNSRDLYTPETNIQLGSNYLKQLLARFDGNQILATAAYNAGPHRVDRWLKSQSKALPYDVWIETLPYHETRHYVQSVLAFSVIYSHRLGLEKPIIQPHEQRIALPVKN